MRGTSGANTKKILKSLGEERSFLKEGGRTNRGLRTEIDRFLQAIGTMNLDDLSATERRDALHAVQQFLLSKVREFFDKARVKFAYVPNKALDSAIHDILSAASLSGKEGPVAQYLVGAKLQCRFPNLIVSNDSFSSADEQTGRHGDFQIGDTAFHVTVAPMTAVFDKCVQNISVGKRTYLLVPSRRLEGARQMADQIAAGQISVGSVESFVGFNVDEMAEFAQVEGGKSLRALLEMYNTRVLAVENDLSLLIEIPENLK